MFEKKKKKLKSVTVYLSKPQYTSLQIYTVCRSTENKTINTKICHSNMICPRSVFH